MNKDTPSDEVTPIENKAPLMGSMERALRGDTLTKSQALKLAHTIVHLTTKTKEMTEENQREKDKFEEDRTNFNTELELMVELQGKTKTPLFREIQRYHRKAAQLNKEKLSTEHALKKKDEIFKNISDTMKALLTNAYGIIKEIHDLHYEVADKDFVSEMNKRGAFDKIQKIVDQLTNK